jgi:hypothetical protein
MSRSVKRYPLQGAWSAYFGPSHLLESETSEDRNQDLVQALEALNSLMPQISETLQPAQPNDFRVQDVANRHGLITTEESSARPQTSSSSVAQSAAAQPSDRAGASHVARQGRGSQGQSAQGHTAQGRVPQDKTAQGLEAQLLARAQATSKRPSARAQTAADRVSTQARHGALGRPSRPARGKRLDQPKKFPPQTRDQLARWLDQQKDSARARWRNSGRIIPAGSTHVTIREEDRKK